MRRAPGWQGALRTSLSCLPVNAALDRHAHHNTLLPCRGGVTKTEAWRSLELTAESRTCEWLERVGTEDGGSGRLCDGAVYGERRHPGGGRGQNGRRRSCRGRGRRRRVERA